MKEHYDFSKGIKNPYYELIKKNGYKVIINYGNAQEDKFEIQKDAAGEYVPLPEEVEAFKKYNEKTT